ncbi:hypothetical protein KAR91_71415 [Candidatus Pacearchaeota archaeon]|nr:hypothetical protein [Candidatus Pacearchaeota archaeon]
METKETQNISKIRLYLRGKAKLIALYAGAATAVLSVIVYWSQLEAPDMPWVDDVAAAEVSMQENLYKVEVSIREDMVEDRTYAQASRRMILNGDWMRVNTQIQQKKAELVRTPMNQKLMQEISILERTLLDIETELARLNKNG